MAEIPGMREAAARQEQRLRQNGVPAEEAARIARASALRVDRKIEDGTIPAPKKG